MNITRLLKIILSFTVVLYLGVIPMGQSVSAETVDEMFSKNNQESENKEAETPSAEEKSTDTNKPSFLESLFRLLIGLGVVILLIFYISKWAKRKTGFANPNQFITNIGGVPVGQNKQVQLIKIGKRYFLIGVGENVDLLTEITDEETIEQIESSGIGTEEKKPENSTMFNMENLLSKELSTMKESRTNLLNNLRKKIHK